MSIESRKHQYGRVFGHWQIKEFLGSGSGGKSAVFRLDHTESRGVESALKVISLIEERGRLENFSYERQQEYLRARNLCSERAEREVLLMNKLQGNSNIVDYLDHTFVDWTDETGFGRDMLIRMEKLTDLRSQISIGKQFSREEILKIGKDICTALALCHGQGILHRDIKPENVFVNKNGSYKLGDFGISRMVSATSSAVASTGIGTPQYWAPEQTSGKYDVRVDIYGLGLILYELSNKNRLPFAQSSYVRDEEIHRRLLGEALPAPCNADTTLSQIILKACAFHPEDRYSSAKEFLYALDQLEIPTSYETEVATGNGNYVGNQTEIAKAYRSKEENSCTDKDAAKVKEKTSSTTNKKLSHSFSHKHHIAIIATAVLAILICGYFFIHIWTEATCTDASVCKICGKENSEALGHVWDKATCTRPSTCSLCGLTTGDALGHAWIDATLTTPQTCAVCGETVGKALVPSTWYINEMQPIEKYGKIWVRTETSIYDVYHTKQDAPACWSDMATVGQTIGVVTDNKGNIYRYGFHLDGEYAHDYYISFDLYGVYTTFAGTCAFPGTVINDTDTYQHSKGFKVFGDGVLLKEFTGIKYDSMPYDFEIDVTGIKVLTIVYPSTFGPNEAATLFDGRVMY